MPGEEPDQAPGHPGVERLVAPNPGPMTLAGTNTYLFGEGPCVVIDPGPAHPEHLAAVRDAAERRGGMEAVLITHRHRDHDEGAESLGAPVILPAEGPTPGGLRAIATPGHSPEHVCLLGEGGVCFSGDLVLGEGSTFVPPEGRALIDFLSSLERLRGEEPTLICPGHGPWVTDPAAKIDEYVEHKLARERRLLEAIGRGETSRSRLLAEVWDDAPAELHDAARAVMTAHLEKLRLEGRLTVTLTD